MVILNADHPDIERFIWCKAKEEKKAHTLIDAGYDSSLDGDAYSSIFFQNANNSVRATDEFMEAVADDRDWWTKSVSNGEPEALPGARPDARDRRSHAWQCGDPGMQFDTTINRWHTSKNTARINASNPCSEYMFLDDSACNLASLNLMKFVGPGGVSTWKRSATPWIR
jgi:ribonucleoside-diphosphate reductase alpha chain